MISAVTLEITLRTEGTLALKTEPVFPPFIPWKEIAAMLSEHIREDTPASEWDLKAEAFIRYTVLMHAPEPAWQRLLANNTREAAQTPDYFWGRVWPYMLRKGSNVFEGFWRRNKQMLLNFPDDDPYVVRIWDGLSRSLKLYRQDIIEGRRTPQKVTKIGTNT